MNKFRQQTNKNLNYYYKPVNCYWDEKMLSISQIFVCRELLVDTFSSYRQINFEISL